MAAFETLPAAKAIACIGDSLTALATSRADRPYPAVLDELLYEDGVVAANHGIGGTGISTAQTTYTTFLKGRGLWGVVLMIGVNDLAAGTPATTIFSAINALVSEMLSDGLRVALCTILPWKNGGGWTAPIQVQTEALNTSIRGLIGTNARLRIADGYAKFGQVDDPTLLQTSMQALGELDGLHFGTYGAQVFARFLATPIRELVAGANTSSPLAPSVGIQPEALAARALREYLLRWLPAKTAQINALRAAVVKSAAVGPFTIASGNLVLASAREGSATTVTLPTGTVTAAQVASAINAAAVPGVTASADGDGRVVLTGVAPTEGVLSCVSVRGTGTGNALFGWPAEGCYDVESALTAPTWKGVMDGMPVNLPDFGRTYAVVIGDRSAVGDTPRKDMHTVTLDVSIWVADRGEGQHRTRELLQSAVRCVRELLDSDDGRTLGRGTVGDIIRVSTAAKMKGAPYQVFDEGKRLVGSGEVASLTVTVRTFHRPSLTP